MTSEESLRDKQNVLIDKAAQKVIRTRKVNGPVILRIIDDTFGSVPQPDNVVRLVMKRCKKIKLRRQERRFARQTEAVRL